MPKTALTSRTQAEILARMKAIEKNDFFGYQRTDLVDFLDFKHAKPFLNKGTTAAQWAKARTNKDVKTVMREYMEFAWEKANDKRGLSAGRTMEHYKTWLWLDGNDKLSEQMDDYCFYGKPQLELVCQYLGLDSKKWDDGVRENS